MKYKLQFSIIIIVIMMTFSAACGQTGKTDTRRELFFGTVAGDNWDISDVRIDYDSNILEKKIPVEKSSVYVSTKIEDCSSIAEKFGFSASQICSGDDATVEYRSESGAGLKRLIIWPTGKIRYDTGVKETYYETIVSVEDCVELSKEVLKQYELTNNDFDKNYSVSTTMITDPEKNESKITGYTVSLFFQLAGSRLCGEPHVDIKFNGNGEVVSVMYYMPNYIEAGETKLVSISRILKKIQRGDVPVIYGLDDAPDRITIEDVELCYYSQRDENDMAVVQPVYLFSAVGHYGDEDLPFDILVQAN